MPDTSPLDAYRLLCAHARTEPDPRILAYLAEQRPEAARIVNDVMFRSSNGSAAMRKLELTFEAGARADVLRQDVDAALRRYNADMRAERAISESQRA